MSSNLLSLGPACRARIRARHGIVRVGLAGDLDVAAVDDLNRVLADLRGTRTVQVEIDLRGLTFLDGAGLGALLRAGRLFAGARVGLRVVPGRDQVQRLFALTGTEGELPFVAVA